MIVKMHFDGTNVEERYDFTQILTAFSSRGGEVGKRDERGMPVQQTLSKADRRSDAAIKKALYGISEPVLSYPLADGTTRDYPTPKPGEPDLRPRQLKDLAELVLTLEQPEFERLQRFFDSDLMGWFALAADRIEEISQRMAAAMASASKDTD